MKPPQPMYNAILNYVGGENEEGADINMKGQQRHKLNQPTCLFWACFPQAFSSM